MRITVLLSLAPFAIAHGQGTYQRIIQSGSGQGRAVATAANGDLFLAAQYSQAPDNGMQVVRYDPTGTMLWAQLLAPADPIASYLVNDIAATSDDGVVIAGSRLNATNGDSAFVAKLSAAGALQWARCFKTAPASPDLDCFGYRVAEAPNGDLLVGGVVNDQLVLGNFHDDLFLARFSVGGTLQWTKQITAPITGTFNRFGDIAFPAGGGITIAGQTALNTEGSWLLHLSDAGVPDQVMLYDTNNGLDLRPFRLFTTAGGYVIDYTTPFGAINMLHRITTDADGVLLSSQRYDIIGIISATPTDVVTLADGGQAVTGSVTHHNTNDGFLIRLDATGVPQWGMAYGTGGYETLNAVTTTSDGGFLLAGHGEEDSLVQFRGGLATKTYLVKCDANGVSMGCEEEIIVNIANPGFTSSAYSQAVADTSGWAPAIFSVSPVYSEISVCPELGIAGQQQAAFTVFPDRAMDRLYVNGPAALLHDATVMVIDPLGRVVLRAQLDDDRTVPITPLTAGTYIVTLAGGNGAIAVARFVKE